MFILLISLSLLSQAVQDSDIQRGFVNSRSANVVTKGQLLEGNNNLLLVDGPNIKNCQEAGTVPQMGDLVTRSLWVGKLKKGSAICETNTNLPTSILMMTSFGVDRAHFEDFPHKQRLATKSTFKLNLETSHFPASKVAVLTSIMTGHNPNLHGVPDETWEEGTRTVEAFSAPETHASQPSIEALIKNHYHDTQLVAGSAQKAIANALAQDGVSGDYYIKDQMKFHSSNPSFSFTPDDLEIELKESLFWTSLADQLKKIQLTPDHLQFLMEMEYLRRVADSMKSSDHEVIYSLASTTLPEDAPQYILQIYSFALAYLKVNFRKAYPDGLSQLAFIKLPKLETHALLESKMSSLDSEINLLTPRVESKHFNVVCATDDVTCLGQGIGSSCKPGDCMKTLMIGYWFAIFMIITLICFTYSMSTMKYDTDALLFTTWQRGFN